MDKYTTRYKITHVKTAIDYSKPAQRGQGQDDLRDQEELEQVLQDLRTQRDYLLQVSYEVEEQLERQLQKLKQPGTRTLPQTTQPADSTHSIPTIKTSPQKSVARDDKPPESTITSSDKTDESLSVSAAASEPQETETRKGPKVFTDVEPEEAERLKEDSNDLEPQASEKPTESPSTDADLEPEPISTVALHEPHTESPDTEVADVEPEPTSPVVLHEPHTESPDTEVADVEPEPTSPVALDEPHTESPDTVADVEPQRVESATEDSSPAIRMSEQHHESSPPVLTGPPPHMVQELVSRFNNLEQSAYNEMQNIESQQNFIMEKVATLKGTNKSSD